MALQIIEPTDSIPCNTLVMVIYGGPGVGKTSLAQTADNPITLDTDTGIHRSFNRKKAARIAAATDLGQAFPLFQGHSTVVVDTVGRVLDFMTSDILRETAKNGQRATSLSPQGWGVLKGRFTMWVQDVRQLGKDLILIAHEKEEKDGEDRIFRPEVQGGSYTELHKVADLIGYLSVDKAGKRTLNFNRTDRSIGKGGWVLGTVPCGENPDDDFLGKYPRFLADLIKTAKEKIGLASAVDKEKIEADEFIGRWETWVKNDVERGDAETFDAAFKEITEEFKVMSVKKKTAVWTGLLALAKGHGIIWDAAKKMFVKKAGA